MTEDEVYRTAIRTFYDFPTADFETQLRAVLHVAREQTLREAAKRAAELTEPLWGRPYGPPGNGWIPLTGKHVADAILALISAPPKETPDDN